VPIVSTGFEPETQAEIVEAVEAELRSKIEAMGPVNLVAATELTEAEAQHTAIVTEQAELTEAVNRLRGSIGALNREGRERLRAAFEAVDAHFRRLFARLFGGGEARLVLEESDDPLEAGLEIMCQPPGKKLATMSLLSGGEQTLTALALIFGVFLANPAPICVLDEVDAPLDDANVTRFCDLLDEMARRTDTRFLIITHHAVTMARMDRLFGVTMVEQGVSQLVSVDLKKAEALVA
jgi:chromosome segregation protein